MEKPNMEATLYCHVELMSAMMRGLKSQHAKTAFNNQDISELISSLEVGLRALQLELDRVYDRLNERSVCY